MKLEYNIETIKHSNKKFIESFFYGDGNEEWEIETDTGWVEIKAVGKTIEYKVYYLKTNRYELLCADQHIVFKKIDENIFQEIFVTDLKSGDIILTEKGEDIVILVYEMSMTDNMYDLQLNNENKRYYTNGILSHNSLFLCNLACEGIKQGYNVAYISLEMAENKIIKRLACNLLSIPSKEYDILSEDSSFIKKKINNIITNSLSVPGALRVKEFPTSAASVSDIENWVKRVEEKRRMKFNIVIIDYIGIMRNSRNPNSENSYMKIKQISEDLRAMAMRNNWCILTASQFNRGAYNTNDVILEQIAESAALIHTVDGLFGIIQDEIMYMNCEYYLKTLANREEGYKNSKKRFIVSYDYMRITEDLNSEIINPQF